MAAKTFDNDYWNQDPDFVNELPEVTVHSTVHKKPVHRVGALAFDNVMAASYTTLWETMVIHPEKLATVDSIANRIIANKATYQSIEAATKVPWIFIGMVHNLECGLSFERHLHNGDPLTAKTVHVPAGRPVTGSAPYSFFDSAVDALQYTGLTSWSDWSIAGMLFKLEGYNGYGYRLYHPTVNSPYLWSFSNQYTRGKYVADGHFDATAVSDQAGCACILKRVMEKSNISTGVVSAGFVVIALLGAAAIWWVTKN